MERKMMDTTLIEKINSVIEEYFVKNKELTIVPVKGLMPALISAGIFKKDIRKGLPIRKVLNELDAEKQLDLIPYVYAERKEKITYWYFMPLNATKPTTPYKQTESSEDAKTKSSAQFKNDEAYIIDLCDRLLGQEAFRQKKFGFLLGDLHKNGKSQTELPIDAYYEALNLAIEYKIKEHAEDNKKSKQQEKETVSGVSRREQRIRYDLRKEKVLTEHDIAIVNISNADFSCDDKHKIIRNEEKDMGIVRKALRKYIDAK